MESFISFHVAEFRKTWKLTHLGKAVLLIVKQKRCLELIYGIYCNVFFKPSTVALNPYGKDIQSVTQAALSFSSSEWSFSREKLIDIFRARYAIHHLPSDFCVTRSESIIWDQDFLIIGEYGIPEGKRLFYVTRHFCISYDHYQSNGNIAHIHALHKASSSCDILVTTGDSEKRLDLWRLEADELVFSKTLRKSLAGHSAITKVGNVYYLGSDFSSRPNYIERLSDGKKFFFPYPAYKMCVLAFQEHQNRFIAAVSTDLSPLGDKRALSVFDTAAEEFVYCDCIGEHTAGKALNRTAIPRRSIPTDGLLRWASEAEVGLGEEL